MTPSLEDNFALLIDSISGMGEVQAIGKSGGKELPQNNESDIDIFVFCDAIPSGQERRARIEAACGAEAEITTGAVEDKHWGVCDYVDIESTEVCLLFFSTAQAEAEIEAILRGERVEKEANYFYPTGRCATYLTMHSLYDPRGFLAAMRAKLSVYPAALAQKLVLHHLGHLSDVEDLERAVSRQDVLFYHFALDIALDHFLQALFAANGCFFPSRKRTFAYLQDFCIQPARCAERLAQVVALGGSPGTLAESYTVWSGLCNETVEIIKGWQENRAIIK